MSFCRASPLIKLAATLYYGLDVYLYFVCMFTRRSVYDQRSFYNSTRKKRESMDCTVISKMYGANNTSIAQSDE